MPEVVKPATVVGELLPAVAAETGMKKAAVIATAGHDTAAAAAAAPYAGEDCAFLSCGTWSVLGLCQEHPTTTAEALAGGFANILGVDSVLLVKEFAGLYLFESFQRAREARGQKVTYSRMIQEASLTEPFGCFLDLNWPRFFAVADPKRSIREFLRGTGQDVSQSDGSIIRALLEGLAWNYRTASRDLAKVAGKELKRISLVGGGSRNKMLCQMAADATRLEVVAGPAEATAVGNLATQALATGRLQDADHV